MSDINLIRHSEDKSPTFLNKVVVLRVLSFVLLFAISFFSITLFILIALSPLPSLQEQEQDAISQLAPLHPKMAKLLMTKERIGHIQNILQKRPEYSEILQQVSQQVPAEAAVDNLKLEGENISLSVSSPSLEHIDSFTGNIMRLNSENKYFSKIKILSLFLNVETNRYTLFMELAKNEQRTEI
jgi:Tfp pilus assembly protein PilN